MTDHPAFDVDRILRDTFAAEVDYYPTVTSTSDLARHRASQETLPRSPFLVLAPEQTAGRGRLQREWWSAPGALTFSLMIRDPFPDLPRRRWPTVSLTSALAVIEALDRRLPAPKPHLRWPNDIYVAEQKLCGILPELIEVGGASWLILGIGINVNNSAAAAPPEIQQLACSLVDLTATEHELTDVLVDVLEALERHLARLREDDVRLADEWQTRCGQQGATLTVGRGSDKFTGTCAGIDREGRLLLDTESGRQAFDSGTVLSHVSRASS